jgi:hypothetical protein
MFVKPSFSPSSRPFELMLDPTSLLTRFHDLKGDQRPGTAELGGFDTTRVVLSKPLFQILALANVDSLFGNTSNCVNIKIHLRLRGGADIAHDRNPSALNLGAEAEIFAQWAVAGHFVNTIHQFSRLLPSGLYALQAGSQASKSSKMS